MLQNLSAYIRQLSNAEITCTLTKCFIVLGLVAWICLTNSDAGAASKVNRCTFASCLGELTPAVHSAKRLRRHRRTDDAVSRLQKKIAEQQAERRTKLERDRQKYSYSELYRRRSYSTFRRIPCRKGQQLVRSEGFYRVSMLECQGRIFTYLARANGKMVRVMVDSRFGTIVGTRPF
jgi:hypothetical protein